MAWTAMPTFVAGPLTAAQLNVLVGNLNETAPAKATTAGRIFVSTGANAVAERVPSGNTVATSQTTTSIASFGDLATVGPAVTVTSGTRAIVILSATMANNTGTGGTSMAYAVSGASSIAASADKSMRHQSGTASMSSRQSTVIWENGLTAGSNTFTAKYTTPTGGTGTFYDRDILVIPL